MERSWLLVPGLSLPSPRSSSFCLPSSLPSPHRLRAKSCSCVFLLVCLPGRVRTRRQSSGSVGGASQSVVDSRGRSRAKVVSQSQRKSMIINKSSSCCHVCLSEHALSCMHSIHVYIITVCLINAPTQSACWVKINKHEFLVSF